jgi:hypothetical protein
MIQNTELLKKLEIQISTNEDVLPKFEFNESNTGISIVEVMQSATQPDMDAVIRSAIGIKKFQVTVTEIFAGQR